MPDPSANDNDFISQITTLIGKNISNEQFGVSELADAANMSRSNLLRKVKKTTNLSVSQLISEVRLAKGMELLKGGTLNVSEVAHEVGFSSTSYFIKCFREYYGYPPGEVGKRGDSSEPAVGALPLTTRPGKKLALISTAGVTAIIFGLLAFYYWPFAKSAAKEKSIAVLPFKNDSNDSTNVYLINGLMESTLNNLQKIKDLKVISRTSTEKYRNNVKSIPEMAKELKVTYFVEGSGQKLGDRILLNIQLIEGGSDKHLWAKQYRREAKDIFQLQQEIAQDIANEIQAVITPDEQKRIKKNPTENLVAYDFFLKGQELFFRGSTEGLEAATPYFKKAIAEDNKFALAYAGVAMVDYYLDLFHTEKKYLEEINNNADKALLYDGKLAESLVAKSMYYMEKKEYGQAIPHLEKALEYNPNSSLVIHFLADLYNSYVPNTSKYLEYALKGLRINVGSNDSVTTSFTYMHIGNAFVQTGFLDEALRYMDKSLEYNPRNPFSGYIKVFVLYAKNRDIKATRGLLEKELAKDTTRIDVIVELATICYDMGDYKTAHRLISKFLAMKESQHLDIFNNSDLMIGIVLEKMGEKEKSQEYARRFKAYADNDKTIYKHLNQAMYCAYRHDVSGAIKNMKLFSREDNYQYWVLLFPGEPSVSSIKDLPEFKKVMAGIESKFWDTHKKIKARLEEEGLL